MWFSKYIFPKNNKTVLKSKQKYIIFVRSDKDVPRFYVCPFKMEN